MIGDQRPRILHTPGGVCGSGGREAVELAAQAGVKLDPWQRLVLEHALAERSDGRWVSFEAAVVVARQNGKGEILLARELAGLFLLGEQLIIHSAHLFDTSLEAFRRILERIESTPSLDSRVARVSRSHGEEGIELKSRQRLRFKTRTPGGGRGLSADCTILDESMILADRAVSALMPTMSARSVRGNPQLWYAGSAGNEESAVLARLRRRALAGDDPSLCYAEWSVDEDSYDSDPDGVAVSESAWAAANPGMGIRISAEHIGREQRSMDRVEFARERLGIGTWPAPDEAWTVIPETAWLACRDPGAAPAVGVFGLDITRDRSMGVICSAGQTARGPQVEVVNFDRGTDWIVARCVELHTKYQAPFVVDSRSQAAERIPDLTAASVPVLVTSTTEFTQACGGFFTAVTEGPFAHLGQPALDAAVAGARKRDVEGAWAFDRRIGTNIAPLVAATLALWALNNGHGGYDVESSIY